MIPVSPFVWISVMGVIELDQRLQASVSDEAADRESAFRRLADQHLDRCYRLAAAVLGNGNEAQDAVHDAFVSAWRKYDSLRDTARMDAWFDRIVVNTCRDRMRRAHRIQVRDISTGLDIASSDPTAAVPDEVVIEHALERLGPDDRIVLALRFYRDMKVDDIAVAMGIRPRAATSRLHRALERLRKILDEDEQEVSP